MRKIKGFRLSLILLFCWVSQGQAAQASQITLRDGSSISGEILSFDGTRYLVRSGSLGTVSIDSHQVEQIRSSPETGNRPPGALLPQDRILSLQQQLVGDPQTMTLVQSLQDDPQMQRILSDPRLLQAILAGDIQVLRDSPELQGLMNHPAVKKIQERAARY